MISTKQLKIGSILLMLSGLSALATALFLRQPMLLLVGAILIGVGRIGLRRALQRN